MRANWAQVPLLIGTNGHRLNKRHGSLAVAALRARERKPEQIIGRLTHLTGWFIEPAAAQPHDLIWLLHFERLPPEPIAIDPILSTYWSNAPVHLPETTCVSDERLRRCRAATVSATLGEASCAHECAQDATTQQYGCAATRSAYRVGHDAAAAALAA